MRKQIYLDRCDCGRIRRYNDWLRLSPEEHRELDFGFDVTYLLRECPDCKLTEVSYGISGLCAGRSNTV